MKLAIFPLPNIRVAIYISDLTISIENIVWEITFVFKVIKISVNSFTLLNSIIKLANKFRMISKSFFTLSVRYVIKPLTFIVILFLQIKQLSATFSFSISNLTLIRYSETIYQSSFTVWYTIEKISMIIRTVGKVHFSFSMRSHKLPLSLINNSQSIDSPRFWIKSPFIILYFWVKLFHSHHCWFYFFIQFWDWYNWQLNWYIHLGMIFLFRRLTFHHLTLFIYHISFVLYLNIICTACLAHTSFKKLSI